MRKILFIAMLLTPVLLCQSAEAKKRRWEYPATPYFWIAGQSGTVALGSNSESIDEKFNDLFDNFNWGATLHLEAQSPTWAFIGDLNYKRFRPGQDDKVATIKTWLVEAAVSYRVFDNRVDRIEVLGGARYFGVNAEITQNNVPLANGNHGWTDPIVGGRYSRKFNKEWTGFTRADVGGFGVGSDFSWNLAFGAAYNVGTISFVFAYRIWSADYESGSGDDFFKWDVTTSGPGIGFTFHL